MQLSLATSLFFSSENNKTSTLDFTSAYEDGTDRRFRNVGIYKPDAGELP